MQACWLRFPLFFPTKAGHAFPDILGFLTFTPFLPTTRLLTTIMPFFFPIFLLWAAARLIVCLPCFPSNSNGSISGFHSYLKGTSHCNPSAPAIGEPEIESWANHPQVDPWRPKFGEGGGDTELPNKPGICRHS